ncbi:hypothetical protein JCM12296A_17390 [Desulfosarcina cetonica]
MPCAPLAITDMDCAGFEIQIGQFKRGDLFESKSRIKAQYTLTPKLDGFVFDGIQQHSGLILGQEGDPLVGYLRKIDFWKVAVMMAPSFGLPENGAGQLEVLGDCAGREFFLFQ